MLYVFHGTDITTAGIKARALIESLRAKRPDAAYEKLDGDSWDPAIIESHLGGQGLFSSKYIVFLDRVTENAEAKEALPNLAVTMHESTNIFIVLEGKINAALKKAIEKSAEKVIECEKKVGASDKPDFNIFGLAGAVGNRETFKAWTLYREAVDQGMESEAIIGMLFWKAKSMGNRELARELVVLYHEGHRGRRSLELGIEQCILNLARQ